MQQPLPPPGKVFDTDFQALCYLTECTLETVEKLEGLKRPGKHELERQRSIAAIGVYHVANHYMPDYLGDISTRWGGKPSRTIEQLQAVLGVTA